MIIKHYEAFKTDLLSMELDQKNWDVLRTISEESAYAIEKSVEEYEKNCLESKAYALSAQKIVDVLKEYDCKHIVSLGIGKGILEWHMKKLMPELFVEGTDYAPLAIEKLKKVFAECDSLHCFDMLQGDYREFENNVFFVMYRVSEELSYNDWCHVFNKMRKEGVCNIIFIPDMLATEELAKWMEKRHQRNIERGRRETFCGWVYSEDVLKEIFLSGEYRIVERYTADELVIFLLQ